MSAFKVFAAKSLFRQTLILPIIVILLSIFSRNLGAQAPSGRLDMQLELMPGQAQIVKAGIIRETALLAQQVRQKKLAVPAKEIRRLARKEFVAKQKLSDFHASLTPESKVWFSDFYNRYRPSHMPEFVVLLQRHRNLSIREIRDIYEPRDTLGTSEKKLPKVSGISPSTALVPMSISTSPFHTDIVGSKLILKDYYNGNQRHLISRPNQDLYLRGSYSQVNSPYFPDYANVHCDNCCGPAAGQSILEWFAVPVKKPNGTVLTSTNDIQKRLSNLMETEDGIDYTHPDDLARTLMRDEYVGNKGYCYKDGGGRLSQVHYMLSAGTPVILLIAEDSWAHYITIYGYKLSTNEYLTANSSTNYSKSKLLDLWKFNNTSAAADTAYFLTNTNSQTLFSYSPDGCDKEWSYGIVHTNPNAYPGGSRSDLYYNDFNASFVDFRGENAEYLNFYGFYRWKSGTVPLPVTDVGSSRERIWLMGTNSKIVAYHFPYADTIVDNSSGQPIGLRVSVDKRFIDKYDELHCGFIARDESDTAVLTDYGLCKTRTSASALSSSLYDITYLHPFQPNQKLIEFVLHGGFRKHAWALSGCSVDTDGDTICNSFDDDDDNDGVMDVGDNCPLDSNADQTDNDSNGVGLACDNKEKCLIGCDPNYYTDARNSLCAYHCSGRMEPSLKLDPQWDRLFASKWWDVLKDLGKPGIPDRTITRNVAFRATLEEYRAIRKSEGVSLSRRQARKEWLDLVRDLGRQGEQSFEE